MKIKQKPAAVFTAVLLAVSLFQPVSAGTWHTAGDGLYYREAGKNTVGWKRIADETGVRHWYYFGEDGKLVRNADTPDGFRVNGDGVFAGISQKGVEQAFAAAEKAKESAQQAYERNYYAELRAKAAEEAARVRNGIACACPAGLLDGIRANGGLALLLQGDTELAVASLQENPSGPVLAITRGLWN